MGKLIGRVALGAAVVCAIALLWGLLVTNRVMAHGAPSGWSYPTYCCSGVDCREVPASSIGMPSSKFNGYTIKGTGETILTTDYRIKPSPDGLYHWCSVAGADDGRTICLFIPPPSY